MPQRVITDSSETDIPGPNRPDRNDHAVIIPILKLSQANDSNEEESDSDSDDGLVFCREITIMPANKNEESEAPFNKIYSPKKIPLYKVTSLESNASTASSESCSRSVENREPSSRSSTCSESDGEDELRRIKKSEADLIESIRRLQVTEKSNDKKNDLTSSKKKDSPILSTQTLKLNLNCEVDDAKYLIGKKRILSSNWQNNIHRGVNAEVSDENQDSNVSDRDESSDSEDDDTYVERGPAPRPGKPNYSKAPYTRLNENRDYCENQAQLGENILKVLDTIRDQVDPEVEEKIFQGIPEQFFRPSLPRIIDQILVFDNNINDDSWTVKPSLLTIPSITVESPLSSTSSQPVGSVQSLEWHESSFLELSNEDSLNGGSENMGQEGTRGNLSDPFLSSLVHGLSSPGNSISDLSSSTTDLSPLIGEIHELNSMEPLSSSPLHPVLEKNEINIAKEIADPRFFINDTRQSSSLVMSQIPNNTYSSLVTASSEQYSLIHVPEVPITPIPVKSNSFDTFNSQMENNARNTISPVRPFSNMYPSRDTATAKPSKFNLKNLNGQTIPSNVMITNEKDSNSVTMKINGSPDTIGTVVIANHHKSFINSTNNGNVAKHTPSLNQNVNGTQVPINSRNDYKRPTWNFESNIVQPSNSCNGQTQQQTSSNTTVLNSSIPTPVEEKSQPMSQVNSKSICPWDLLKLPDSNACERLKKAVKNSDVRQAMYELISWPIGKYTKAQKDSDDTFLMSIVSNPRKLKKYLHFIAPMVEKMVDIPGSLMKRNDQGRDALYLAAINCPNNSYVTGYLAITIAKLCQENDIHPNTYNSTNDTLMHVVAEQGDTHLDVMKELLAIKETKGYSAFDPSAQNSNGNTPLHLAVQACNRNQSKQSVQMVRLLIKHGVNTRHRENKSGNTALHMAISHSCSKAIVQALLDSTVDCTAVNVKNYAGNLPIHLAASDLNFVSLQTQADICRRLVDNGSPTNIPNKQNKMPLALVVAERKEIIRNIFHKKF